MQGTIIITEKSSGDLETNEDCSLPGSLDVEEKPKEQTSDSSGQAEEEPPPPLLEPFTSFASAYIALSDVVEELEFTVIDKKAPNYLVSKAKRLRIAKNKLGEIKNPSTIFEERVFAMMASASIPSIKDFQRIIERTQDKKVMGKLSKCLPRVTEQIESVTKLYGHDPIEEARRHRRNRLWFKWSITIVSTAVFVLGILTGFQVFTFWSPETGYQFAIFSSYLVIFGSYFLIQELPPI